MAISGLWQQNNGASALANYAGPLQWGTGYNPVHAVQGQTTPGRIIDPGTTGQNPVPEDLASNWNYLPGDYYGEAGDPMLRALPDQLSEGWDRGTVQGTVPGNYPAYGPYGDPGTELPEFPVSGPPGGTDFRTVEHHSREEAQGSPELLPEFATSGHYQSKGYLGIVATAVESDPSQYVVNTSDVQGPGKQTMDNSRAVARDTDQARSAITSRVRGQRLRKYAHGAPGPDMYPYQQDLIIRPFISRTVGMSVPPPGGYTYMEGTQFDPIQYAAPPDPYEGEPPVDYGYSPEDVTY